MGYLRRASNYLERITISNPTHMMSMADPVAIGVMDIMWPISQSHLMDIMWPTSQSHFHVSCLCSLK